MKTTLLAALAAALAPLALVAPAPAAASETA